MRILLLAQVVPRPPDSGPKVKTHSVLRYLARNHEVHLACFARTPAEHAHADSLRDLCASVTVVPLRRSRIADAGYLVRSVMRRTPFLIERDRSSAMTQAVRDLLGNYRFDAIHADQLSMAHFAVDAPVPLRVLDTHNAVWTIVQRAARRERLAPRRVLAELEWRKLKAHEGSMCRRFDAITVVSEADRRALEAAAGSPVRAIAMPIAVDTDELEFRPPSPEAQDILSVATMFYPPNVEGVSWFLERVYPLIRRGLPDTRFFVVGSRPPPRITRGAASRPGVVVTGYVADLQPYLRRCRVLVVPVHSGSGMRVKILEAFARGIPVVTTTLGFEGIDAHAGEHLLVADDAEEFASAVTRLLRDADLAARLACAGRQLVAERYDWRTALRKLDCIY